MAYYEVAILDSILCMIVRVRRPYIVMTCGEKEAHGVYRRDSRLADVVNVPDTVRSR